MFCTTLMPISVQELICWILRTGITLDIADKLGQKHNNEMNFFNSWFLAS